MISLSWWEEFIVGAALSFLTVLMSKMTNPVEIAAAQAAITFLQSLMNGTIAVTPKPAHHAE